MPVAFNMKTLAVAAVLIVGLLFPVVVEVTDVRHLFIFAFI